MFIFYRCFSVLFILLTLLLISCAPMTPLPLPSNNCQQWQIRGALSIQQPHKTTIAHYTWQQNGENYHIRVFSAFDLYGVNIVGRPGLVTLWREGEHFTAHSPEQLMQQQLGWYLPISHLTAWICRLSKLGQAHALSQSLVLRRRDLTVKIVVKHRN